MTTTWPSRPPANFTNRDRMALSRNLSSAPPITITGPAVPRPATDDSAPFVLRPTRPV